MGTAQGEPPLSKKHGQRKRRKKAARKRSRPASIPLCPSCHIPDEHSPSALLTALADLLNACETAGVKVKFRHGAAYSSHGYVLPPVVKGQMWLARVQDYGRPDATVDYDPDDPD